MSNSDGENMQQSAGVRSERGMRNDNITLQEAASLIRDGINPKDIENMPYVGLEHIEEGTLRLIGVGNSKSVTSTKFRFYKGDILFGKLRPYFRKVIRPNFDGICSTDIWVVRSKESIDQGYLYYWMASKDFVDFSTQGSEGTKMPRAKWEHVSRFQRLRLHESEQRAIAHILGTLDDKIELNRRMNETLEAMARAIFTSWFVDFDPVRAKAEGRPTGLPDEIAALFPDSLCISQTGMVPEGWPLTKMEEQILAVKGLSYKGSGLSDSGIPLHNLNSVYEGGSYKYEGIKYYTGEFKERHLLSPGDLIVTNTEQGFYFLLIGYPAIIPKHFGSSGLFTHHLFRVRPLESSSLTNYYLYFLLMTPNVREQVISATNGTTVNMLSIDGLKYPKFVFPPKELIIKFTQIVSPFFELIENNIEQSCTLIALRDTLLPKIISGELRVLDAERFVEEGE